MSARTLALLALVAAVPAGPAAAQAASDGECDLETRVDRAFTAYRLSERDPQVRLAVEALRACGHEPVLVETGGGSDAGALIEKGFPAVCLCNDMIDVHTDRERIAVSTLEAMVDVSLALIEAARSAT